MNKIIITIIILSILVIGLSTFFGLYAYSKNEKYTAWSEWSDCDDNLKRKRTRKLESEARGIFGKEIVSS